MGVVDVSIPQLHYFLQLLDDEVLLGNESHKAILLLLSQPDLFEQLFLHLLQFFVDIF